jgi:hypothetical protein
MAMAVATVVMAFCPRGTFIEQLKATDNRPMSVSLLQHRDMIMFL